MFMWSEKRQCIFSAGRAGVRPTHRQVDAAQADALPIFNQRMLIVLQLIVA